MRTSEIRRVARRAGVQRIMTMEDASVEKEMQESLRLKIKPIADCVRHLIGNRKRTINECDIKKAMELNGYRVYGVPANRRPKKKAKKANN